MKKPEILIKRAKTLRNAQTSAEKKLWYQLKEKQFFGYKFRRQQAIDNYIADFVCFEKRLIVELDGDSHARRKIYDKKRDRYLADQGFKILRFWNNDVFESMEGVLVMIQSSLETPLPIPPRKGEGI